MKADLKDSVHSGTTINSTLSRPSRSRLWSMLRVLTGFLALAAPLSGCGMETSDVDDPSAMESGELAVQRTGHIKWLNAFKGFGFITLDAAVRGNIDVFFKVPDIQTGLNILGEGRQITCTVISVSKGLEAVNIRVLGRTG